jgi:hypothetical protein
MWMEAIMTKSLSEQLSDLSVHAKTVEDAFAAAQKEGHDKVAARTKEAHAAALAAVENAKRSIKSVGDAGAKRWDTAKAKIAADVDNMKTRVASKKQAIDAKIAEKDAEDAEDDARWAIDYAIASIEQAKFAVFNAVSARLDVNEFVVRGRG